MATKDAEYNRIKAEYEDRAEEERQQKRQQRLAGPVKVANGNNGCRSRIGF